MGNGGAKAFNQVETNGAKDDPPPTPSPAPPLAPPPAPTPQPSPANGGNANGGNTSKDNDVEKIFEPVNKGTGF
ncbi:hypothetical protein H9Q73_013415 [Fusarium xylarioides]|nr:hypothetical protein H9Q73_013415 [Fusarium xylarioides]